MPAGLQVINSANSIYQIDETFFNLILAARGTINAATLYDPRTIFVSPTLTYTGLTPILFLRCTTARAGVIESLRDGNTFKWGIGSSNYPGADSPGTHSVDYFIFDRIQSSPANYGLEVFNAAGERVFNSGFKYLRIVDVQQLPDFNLAVEPITGIPTTTVSVPPFMTLAAAVGMHRHYAPSGDLIDPYWVDGTQIMPSQIQVGPMRTDGVVPAEPHPEQPKGGVLMIADVTGF